MKTLIAIVFPPLAVLDTGRPFSAILNLGLTLCFWIPGVIHALILQAHDTNERRHAEVLSAMTGERIEPRKSSELQLFAGLMAAAALIWLMSRIWPRPHEAEPPGISESATPTERAPVAPERAPIIPLFRQPEVAARLPHLYGLTETKSGAPAWRDDGAGGWYALSKLVTTKPDDLAVSENSITCMHGSKFKGEVQFVRWTANILTPESPRVTWPKFRQVCLYYMKGLGTAPPPDLLSNLDPEEQVFFRPEGTYELKREQFKKGEGWTLTIQSNSLPFSPVQESNSSLVSNPKGDQHVKFTSDQQPKSTPDQRPKSDEVLPPGMIMLVSQDGRNMNARVLMLTKETVLIRRQDGESFDLPLDRLTPETIKRVKEQWEAQRRKEK